MATELQIAANRRNAQLSTGPSETGKKTSRMNAWRHGLTGHLDIRTPEEQEAHDTFCAAIVASLDPAEGIERQFAQSVAEDHWRLNRARSIDNNLFALAASKLDPERVAAETPEVRLALADARAFVYDPASFQLLTIYERRIHANMSKSLKQLTDLKTARLGLQASEKAAAKAQREQALEQARLLTQLAHMEGEPCDLATEYPHLIGFVFSDAEIAQAIYFAERLKQAKHAESTNWNLSIRRAA